MARYLKQAEVIDLFGDPLKHVLTDGSIGAAWEKKILKRITLPRPMPLEFSPGTSVTRIGCHWRIAPLLALAFGEIMGDPTLDKLLLGYSGCYAWRPQRGSTSSISRHAWAVALDINAKQNPQGKAPHPKMHLLADVFEKHGFYWGGKFQGKRVDGMHFEFGGPALLAEFEGVTSAFSSTAKKVG